MTGLICQEGQVLHCRKQGPLKVQIMRFCGRDPDSLAGDEVFGDTLKG